MAKMIIIALLVAIAVAATAMPVSGPPEFEGQLPGTDVHPRYRRYTCDLLSVGGVVSDFACGAHCMSIGKGDGHCNGDICECRN